MFGMDGSDVRMVIKKSENPFHDKHASKRLGMGVGGSSARKKRNTRHLKETGTSGLQTPRRGNEEDFKRRFF